ncbi:poly-gamma-glutamate hydrolase family protein [Streptomyces sp. SBC-4]|nr:poly-gamma-glutamate hydrolase family protein [Streptomyces sp. SBC-4]MDV5148060.1 poly-gamma-glutamate hydrolase family protein [Streptomyces sp. SBC-4]
MSFSDRTASRRTILTALAAATVGAPLVGQLAVSAPAYAGTENDIYDSNTDLYTSTKDPVTEGTDYGRRHKRHEQFDEYLTKRSAPPKTAIMAVHGGQIERGTSELCLAIAGYNPADVKSTLATEGGFHDYWMFEGMRSENNRALHVSSVNCDDHVAVGIAASHLNVLSLHGCQYSQLNMPEKAIWPSTADPKLVVVGGLNAVFRAALVKELNQAGFRAVDAFAPEYQENLKNYAGGITTNICNRTAAGVGAQLEITEDMRRSLFGPEVTDFDWKSGRLATWDNARFIGFTQACRRAIATVEAGQVIL